MGQPSFTAKHQKRPHVLRERERALCTQGPPCAFSFSTIRFLSSPAGVNEGKRRSSSHQVENALFTWNALGICDEEPES